MLNHIFFLYDVVLLIPIKYLAVYVAMLNLCTVYFFLITASKADARTADVRSHVKVDNRDYMTIKTLTGVYLMPR